MSTRTIRVMTRANEEPGAPAGVLGFPLDSLEPMMDFRRCIHQQDTRILVNIASPAPSWRAIRREVLILKRDEGRAVGWPQSRKP